MLVKTKVLPSKIHGLGLFSDEFIPKDTIIWKFTHGFDLKFTKEQIKKFPKQIQEYLGNYSWLSKKSGKYCFASDNGKYCNHSKVPNTLHVYHEDEEEVITKTVRDIQKGEEITEDYGTLEDNFKEENWK